MKSNICITGLLNNYSSNVAKKLADDLELFFADIIKMIEFDIIDIGTTINILGMEYYKKLLNKKLKEVSMYENTVTYLNYYVLNYDNCKENLKNYLTIYLQVDEEFYNRELLNEDKTQLENKLEKGMFALRNKHFASKCDIVINCIGKNEKQIVREIRKKIIDYFEGV